MWHSQRIDRVLREAVVAAAIASVGGCAFGDGQPWGRAAFELTVEIDTPDGRVDDSGRLVTANDYAVAIERIDVSTRTFEVRMTGDEATGFDPADPPPGYSLCHNGHCHSDSGALVDYADIAAELSGGSEAPPDLSVAAAATVTVNIGEPAPLPIDPCATGEVSDCDLPRGELGTLSLLLGEVRVVGRVEDRRSGDRARLVEPIDFEVVIPAGTVAEADLAGQIDTGRSINVTLASALVLPAALFDEVDWASMTTEATVAAIGAALSENDILFTEVVR